MGAGNQLQKLRRFGGEAEQRRIVVFGDAVLRYQGERSVFESSIIVFWMSVFDRGVGNVERDGRDVSKERAAVEIHLQLLPKGDEGAEPRSQVICS